MENGGRCGENWVEERIFCGLRLDKTRIQVIGPLPCPAAALPRLCLECPIIPTGLVEMGPYRGT